MLRTIKVYGHLAKRTGKRVFKAVARTPAEAIKFLLCNYPSLRGVMQQGQYQVLVGSLDLEGSAGNLHLPTGSQDEIRIVPVIVGAGFWKSFGKFFLGAALVTAAFFMPGSVLTIGASTFSVAGTAALSVGSALVLSSIADVISPPPKTPDFDDDPRNNYNFSGQANISREGVPVPVVYGETVVGSLVISLGLNVEED